MDEIERLDARVSVLEDKARAQNLTTSSYNHALSTPTMPTDMNRNSYMEPPTRTSYMEPPNRNSYMEPPTKKGFFGISTPFGSFGGKRTKRRRKRSRRSKK